MARILVHPLKLYRGHSTKYSPNQLRSLRRGCIPEYTYFTTSREEAEIYAERYARWEGGEPVLITVNIPGDVRKVAWEMGHGTDPDGGRYWKTFKRVCGAKIEVVTLAEAGY